MVTINNNAQSKINSIISNDNDPIQFKTFQDLVGARVSEKGLDKNGDNCISSNPDELTAFKEAGLWYGNGLGSRFALGYYSIQAWEQAGGKVNRNSGTYLGDGAGTSPSEEAVGTITLGNAKAILGIA